MRSRRALQRSYAKTTALPVTKGLMDLSEQAVQQAKVWMSDAIVPIVFLIQVCCLSNWRKMMEKLFILLQYCIMIVILLYTASLQCWPVQPRPVIWLSSTQQIWWRKLSCYGPFLLPGHLPRPLQDDDFAEGLHYMSCFTKLCSSCRCWHVLHDVDVLMYFRLGSNSTLIQNMDIFPASCRETWASNAFCGDRPGALVIAQLWGYDRPFGRSNGSARAKTLQTPSSSWIARNKFTHHQESKLHPAIRLAQVSRTKKVSSCTFAKQLGQDLA